jgi:hypothetical protein
MVMVVSVVAGVVVMLPFCRVLVNMLHIVRSDLRINHVERLVDINVLPHDL